MIFWLNILKISTLLLKIGFMCALATAGWQDYKTHSIEVRVFLIAGVGGALLRCIQITAETKLISSIPSSVWAWEAVSRGLTDIGMAVIPGLFLLFLSAITREAVGKGDGYFFVVSGFYLGFFKNIVLLGGGLILCFLVSLIIWIKALLHGRNAGKTRIPFLPFIVPAGIGVIII